MAGAIEKEDASRYYVARGQGDNLTGRRTRILVLVWFFLTGITALVYQVLWARQLELLFGSTVYATSTVLSIFMAGLALGSYFFGKRVDTSASPLRLYAVLEGATGLYALLTVPLFRALPGIVVFSSSLVPAASAGFSPVYFFLSFLLLIIPTFLMGGTLPVLSRFLVTGRHELARKIGNLYFVNTLGAACGSFLAGFVLIFLLGSRMTTAVAAVVNLAVGVSAYIVARKPAWGALPGATPDNGSEAAMRDAEPDTSGLLSRRTHVVILVGYGLAGFAALGLEVQWTKVLTLMIGSSVYAFSLMLSAVLVGIAVGSLVTARLADGRKDPWRDFAIIEILLGLSILVLNPVLGSLPRIFLRVFALKETFWLLQTVQFSVMFILMLVPALLMGAAFPVVSRIYAGDVERLGRRIGQIYAANTAGCILGPLAVSFLFIPLMGLQNSMLLTSAIFVMVGLAALMCDRSTGSVLKRASCASLALVLVSGSIYLPGWNKMAMTSGIYHHGAAFLDAQDMHSLVFYREGKMAVVTVVEARDGDRTLLINGKADASSAGDMGTQLLAGHLPMLLHSGPKKVLVVGLGSGVTVGAITQHPEVQRVDVAELEEGVVEAAREFSRFNHDAMSNPKVRVFATDARNYVLTGNEKYDVISAEPSHPWVRGSSAIFSREVFQLYRDRIDEGGVVMQWVQTYSISQQDLKTMINTFRSVFPHTTVWSQFNQPNLFLIGTLTPLRIDLARLDERLQVESVRKSLARVKSDDLYTILSYFLMDEDALAPYLAGAPINTDDRPIIEYSAPRSMYAKTVAENWEGMRSYRKSALALFPQLKGTPPGDRLEKDFTARELFIQGEVDHELGLWEKGFQAWEEAFRISPTNGPIREGLVFAYGYRGDGFARQGKFREAIARYEQALAIDPQDASALASLGRSYESLGDRDTAIAFYTRGLAVNDRDRSLLYRLGKLNAEKGDSRQGLEYFGRALELNYRDAWAHLGRGQLYSERGEHDKAIEEYNIALSLNQRDFSWYLVRASAYHNKGDYRLALGDYARSIRLKPAAEAYYLRSFTHLALENSRESVKDLDRALSLEPAFDLALLQRARTLAQDGRTAEAIAGYESFLALSRQESLRQAASSELARLRGR